MGNYDFWDWDDEYVPVSNTAMDLSAVPDGTYSGIGADMHGNITVNVTIEGGKITAVGVDEESRGLMVSTDEALDAYFASVLEAQSTEVDGISGATTETTALKEAITLAILSAVNG